MSSFLSLLAKQITNVIAPPIEADGDEAAEIWQNICKCTLDNSSDSLLLLHSRIQDLIEVIKLSSTQGTSKSVIEILTLHQIPQKLVSFSEADIPNGFINEVIPFFAEFAYPPLSEYMHQPFIVEPLNKLLLSHANADQEKFNILIDSILEYLNQYPDYIDKFLINETTSPFLSELLQNLSDKYNEIGEFIFPLLAQTKFNKSLHSFLVNSSPLIQNLTGFVKGCIEKCSINPKKRQFLLFLDIALESAPPDFVASFYSIFEEQIFIPLVSKNQSITASLRSSIYILTSFGCIHIIKPVIQYTQNNILQYLNNDDDKVKVLAIRCIALIMEYLLPKFEQPPSGKVKCFMDFLSLLPSDWFVKQDMKSNIENANSRVNFNFSGPKTVMESSNWDISETLKKLLDLFNNFLDNSMRLNLALTDFFSMVAALPDQGASYFALSDDSDNGLVKALQTLCIVAKRRIGNKIENKDIIEQAYGSLSDGQKDVNSDFCNIVILIEFCKELNSIAQAKNLFHQRDEYFIS